MSYLDMNIQLGSKEKIRIKGVEDDILSDSWHIIYEKWNLTILKFKTTPEYEFIEIICKYPFDQKSIEHFYPIPVNKCLYEVYNHKSFYSVTENSISNLIEDSNLTCQKIFNSVSRILVSIKYLHIDLVIFEFSLLTEISLEKISEYPLLIFLGILLIISIGFIYIVMKSRMFYKN